MTAVKVNQNSEVRAVGPKQKMLMLHKTDWKCIQVIILGGFVSKSDTLYVQDRFDLCEYPASSSQIFYFTKPVRNGRKPTDTQ